VSRDVARDLARLRVLVEVERSRLLPLFLMPTRTVTAARLPG
jgi:hypothetical protein